MRRYKANSEIGPPVAFYALITIVFFIWVACQAC